MTENKREQRIVFGTVAWTEAAKEAAGALVAQGWEVIQIEQPERAISWPEVGRDVAEAIAAGVADRGIALCWTGNGVAISAAGVKGVRAAYCPTVSDAREARLWHNANLLAGSIGDSGDDLVAVVNAWLETGRYERGEHAQAQQRLAAFAAGN